jgi:hypothetical protein
VRTHDRVEFITHVIAGVLTNPQNKALHSYIIDKPDIDNCFELSSFQLPHYKWDGRVAKELDGYQYTMIGSQCGGGYLTEFALRDVKELIQKRRHEIIGWLSIDGIARPHSATIEATDSDAVELAKQYSLPPYSWKLKKIYRLDDKVKMLLMDDSSLDEITSETLQGNSYEVLGWYEGDPANYHPVRNTFHAITDKEAVMKLWSLLIYSRNSLEWYSLNRLSENKRVNIAINKNRAPVTPKDLGIE